MSTRLYEFGSLCLDADARTLTDEGRLVALTPMAVDTLRVLVENSGRVVTRDHLLDTVWRGRSVEDGVLSVNIALLRNALQDAGLPRNAIETVPRRGYRFRWNVRLAPTSASDRSSAMPAARRLYLEGRHYWSQRTDTALMKAAGCFERAAALDPDYAPAYAGLADTYLGVGALAPREAMPRAKAAALRAIALDATLGEAYASLGRVCMAFEWNWAAARNAFIKAIELSPSYITAHQWFANWLAATGRTGDAVLRIRHAQEIDPVSLHVSTGVGFLLYMSRRFGEAVVEYQRVIDMDPWFAPARRELCMALGQLGRHREALDAIAFARTLAPDSLLTAAIHAQALALAGEHAAARHELDGLMPRAGDSHLLPQFIAATLVALGREDEGLTWLRVALDVRCYTMIWLGVDPWFDIVRGDEKFRIILESVGLRS